MFARVLWSVVLTVVFWCTFSFFRGLCNCTVFRCLITNRLAWFWIVCHLFALDRTAYILAHAISVPGWAYKTLIFFCIVSWQQKLKITLVLSEVSCSSPSTHHVSALMCSHNNSIFNGKNFTWPPRYDTVFWKVFDLTLSKHFHQFLSR